MNLISKVKRKNSSLPSSSESAKHLSIQVKLNGFSFCVLDTNLNSFVAIEDYSINNQKEIEQQLQSDFFKQNNFESVDVVFVNDLSTLVPTKLYDEDLKMSYLDLNVNLLKNDEVLQDEIQSIDAFNLYVCPKHIKNVLTQQFQNIRFRHFSTYFINRIISIKSKTKPIVYIEVFDNLFYIAVVKNNQLLLCNYFNFSTKEDFVYYTLFVFEQLKLSVENISVNLFGQIDRKCENFELLYNYVKNVKMNAVNCNLNYHFELDDFEEYKYQSLFNQSNLI